MRGRMLVLVYREELASKQQTSYGAAILGVALVLRWQAAERRMLS
jgi:hypothetical protein